MPAPPDEPPSPPPELFQRLPAQATWIDLVLPPDVLAQLHEIVDRVSLLPRLLADPKAAGALRHAQGTSALFVGASGTGKTLAAEVLASDLGLDLWRVDLSAVVSRYIGETEKNLGRLFDTAENNGAILLFEDADALLGTRTEVKDSHDRYANLEVAYLLQRIEHHAGLTLLTTNRRPAIDPAFTRRLHHVVEFPLPSVEAREALWHRLFPPSTDISHLDVRRLARNEITGGTIRDIATRAALRAAAQATPITMPLILAAAQAELRKLGRAPGVYVEETHSGSRMIEGVATSITAFVGRTLRGPTDRPQLITSFSDFERRYGGLCQWSPLGYAVRQFFLNGGHTALVARLEHQAVAATLALGGGFNLVAADPGSWGNGLRVRVEHAPPQTGEAPDSRFHLHLKDTSTGQIENFQALSTEPGHPRDAARLLADNSNLVRLVDAGTTGFSRPAAHGGAVGAGVDPLDDPASSVPFGQDGSDGESITDDDIVHPSLAMQHRGLWLLDQADLLNLLCIPPLSRTTDVAPATWNTAITYARQRRAFVIVDPPATWASAADALSGLDQLVLRDPNAALYFPRLGAAGPLNADQPDVFGPCGAVAGRFARTDAECGVWKAPAGAAATLTGILGLSCTLSETDNALLNPLAINALRSFPGMGTVVWGARTLAGADHLESDWKYVPVRRLALFIEESLFRGIKWAVFEPNAEPLWSQLRLNIDTFLHGLFRQGAFQGAMPRDAYFVKCDAETTTVDDIDTGIVNILVGFAPLKPAEFVVLRIQQLAGQDTNFEAPGPFRTKRVTA